MRHDKDTALYCAYEDIEGFDPAKPEKNLLFAILMSAMGDLKKEGDFSRRATEFFLSDDEDYIFSFRAICDYLSIDSNRILVLAGLDGRTNHNGHKKVEPSSGS